MTSQHDKANRWRPKFSVRTLVIVVTLVCCYAACWGPTKSRGVEDVCKYAIDAQESLNVDCGVIAASNQLHSESLQRNASSIPLFVEVVEEDVSSGTQVVFLECRTYYFWFFGYIAKLPYERADELPTLLISETGSWDRRAEQSSDVIEGGARSE